MRKECFRVARAAGAAGAIVHLRVPVAVALERNGRRSGTASGRGRVAEGVIERMALRFEPPEASDGAHLSSGYARWEASATLAVDCSDSVEDGESAVLGPVMELISSNSSWRPVPEFLNGYAASSCAAAAHAAAAHARAATSRSWLHATDLALRAAVAQLVASLPLSQQRRGSGPQLGSPPAGLSPCSAVDEELPLAHGAGREQEGLLRMRLRLAHLSVAARAAVANGGRQRALAVLRRRMLGVAVAVGEVEPTASCGGSSAGLEAAGLATATSAHTVPVAAVDSPVTVSGCLDAGPVLPAGLSPEVLRALRNAAEAELLHQLAVAIGTDSA